MRDQVTVASFIEVTDNGGDRHLLRAACIKEVIEVVGADELPKGTGALILFTDGSEFATVTPYNALATALGVATGGRR